MKWACYLLKINCSYKAGVELNMTQMLKPRQGILNPPLKWAGGKRWLVSHLRPIWEKHRQQRLVEPFCGGLAVTLGLGPDQALLNDINAHLVNFFYWIRQGLYIDIPLENKEHFYYNYRKRFNRLLEEGKHNTIEAAKLFYYLNRTGYNGLCRFNKKGSFNVPFGSYKKINYSRDFSVYREAFSGLEFLCDDFERLPLQNDDFIYADPPYDVQFTRYSKQGFDWKDQVRLVRWLAGHKGPVLLSNQATGRIIELYRESGFELFFLDAPRMISCNGNRAPAREVLAMKNI